MIANIASRQHGIVSTGQLRRAGLGPNAQSLRIKGGRLHRLHRGVYAVGHTSFTFESRALAAVLAVEGAVVSHRSASAVWGMLRPHSGPIEVTVPGDGGRRKRRGITIHRSSSLLAGVTTCRYGIAVTKPDRTLRDLHRIVPEPVYRRAVRRALDLRLIRSDVLKREEEFTRSELERMMIGLCRRHRLPPPEVNARIDRYEVDFLWRDQRVILEADSWRHHGDRTAFERDRARDAVLQSLGFRVLRFTYRQVTGDRSTVVAALRALLGQSSLAPNL